MPQRAKHRNQVAIAVLDRAQSRERSKCGVARVLQRRAQMRECLRPVSQPGPDRLQGVVRPARGLHDGIEIRWIEMAGDE